VIKLKIKSGEEIIESLTKQLAEKGIKDAAIVSIIGAVDACQISTMPRDNAKKEIHQEYNEPLELSGTGEIENGKPHIHAVLGRADQTALMGHLEWGKVQNWFVHVYIQPINL
jgi:uncharacterized protein